MIFLPNKFDRFCIGIRNYIQRVSSVSGPTTKQREILRKLHLAKSLIEEEEEIPVNISEYCRELLCAVQIVKIENDTQFNFIIDSKDTFLIKKHIFDSLLMTVCNGTDWIRISSSQKGIAVFVGNIQGESIARLVEKMKGNILTEIKRGRSVIRFDACMTTKKGILTDREVDYLKDPYSVVSLYIKE